MITNRSKLPVIPTFILRCRIVRNVKQVFRLSDDVLDFTFLNAAGCA
jgi:hypothetical protein